MSNPSPDHPKINVRFEPDTDGSDDYLVFCQEFLESLKLDPKTPTARQSFQFDGGTGFYVFHLTIIPDSILAASDEWVCQFRELSQGLCGFKINEHLVAVLVTEAADWDCIKTLPSELENLAISIDASNELDLHELSRLTSLKSLRFAYYKYLSDLGALSHQTSLTHLVFRWCMNLTDIAALSGLRELRYLDFGGCEYLEDISPISALTSITHLDLGGCKKIKNLDAISQLKNLKWLNLSGCQGLTDINILAQFSELRWLNLRGCKNLTDAAPLASLSQLSYLDLVGCENLSDLPTLLGTEVEAIKTALFRLKNGFENSEMANACDGGTSAKTKNQQNKKTRKQEQ